MALRVLEGAEVADRGDYLVVRSPGNPDFWWGNFLLLAGLARDPARAGRWLARFAAEFPPPGTSRSAWTPTDARPEPRAEMTRRSSRPPGWSSSATPCSPAPPSGRRPSQRGGRDPAAGVRRRLAAINRTERALLRPGRAGGLPGTPGGGPAAARRRRAAGRGSAPLPAGGCSPSSGCSTRATATPGTSTSRPTRRPGGRAWPGRSSGTRAGTDARPSGRAPSSSWPTRRMWPSGSTAPAGSPTPSASSASSGRRGLTSPR